MIRNDLFIRMKESRSQRYLFFLLFGMVFIGLLFIFRFYLWTFLFALFFYMALKPVNDRLKKIVKKDFLSATIVMITLFLVILIPLFFVLLALVDQSFHFYIFVQDRISSGALSDLQNSHALKGLLKIMDMEQADLLREMVVLVKETALSTFSGITLLLTFPVTFIIKFFFMLLMLFFLLKDGGNLGSTIYKILPFPDEIEKDVIERLKQVIKVLLAGNLLIMLLQGFMVGLGLFIAGFSAPLLWGTIAGILSLIPVVGTTFIWLPAVIYMVATKAYLMAVFLGLWSLFWYLVLENLLKPLIFGEKLNFHPVIFFFLLLGSIQAFGLAGVIIGPLLLTLFYSLWEIYKLFDVYDMDRRNRE
ncbi:MAG: hypothetical protein CVV44_17865 [Spirochaetae bacterium HGW-Spirochaetae-1]|nr:MAG: hypothetical protein CVV44_17865 [Spirochaetae bacterium HGW-Spirochaetae-1]